MTTTLTNPWTEPFPVVPDWLPETSNWRFHQMTLSSWYYAGFGGFNEDSGFPWFYRGGRSRFLRRLHRDLAVAYAGRALEFSRHPYNDYDLDWTDLFTRRDMPVIRDLADESPRIIRELYDWAQMNRPENDCDDFGKIEHCTQRRLLTLGIPRPWDRRWATRQACQLAQTAHSNWDFSVMPILADMLEDAGCDDADTLRWCRELPPHCWYRGVWVVERLRTTQWPKR